MSRLSNAGAVAAKRHGQRGPYYHVVGSSCEIAMFHQKGRTEVGRWANKTSLYRVSRASPGHSVGGDAPGAPVEHLQHQDALGLLACLRHRRRDVTSRSWPPRRLVCWPDLPMNSPADLVWAFKPNQLTSRWQRHNPLPAMTQAACCHKY